MHLRAVYAELVKVASIGNIADEFALPFKSQAMNCEFLPLIISCLYNICLPMVVMSGWVSCNCRSVLTFATIFWISSMSTWDYYTPHDKIYNLLLQQLAYHMLILRYATNVGVVLPSWRRVAHDETRVRVDGGFI